MKKSIYSLLIGAVILASCGKNNPDPVIPVEEDPIPDDETITIGVTASGSATAGNEQMFTFTGDINKVEFYSGEPGHVYEYRDRTEKQLEGEVNVSFVARVMNSTAYVGTDGNELHAFVSTDFSGEYTNEAISAATWKPLSEKITWPANMTDGPGSDGRIKNDINIVDLMEQGKPFYVGFRYICPPRPPSTSNPRQWRIGFYSLTHEFSGQTVSLSNYETTEWTTTDWKFVILDPENVQSNRASSIVTADGRAINFLGNTTNAGAGITSYDGFQTWAISKAHDIYTVDPDQGVTIEAPSAQYGYVYAAPGTYEATFVLHSLGAEPVVKKVAVTVAP